MDNKKTKKQDEERKKLANEQKKQYYQKHKEEIKARSRKYHHDHRDEILVKQKKWREQNPDAWKEWASKHSEEIKERTKKRYTEKSEELNAKRKELYYQNREDELKKQKEQRESLAKYDQWYDKISPYYDDNQIRRDPENSELIQIKCHLSSCENWVNPTYSQIRARIQAIDGVIGGERHIYCSDECKHKCPTFRQVKFLKGCNPNKDYSRDDQPQLRELVLKRDNYTCQREGCGKSLAEYPDLKLVCHHKFPLNEDPVCSADIDNCITVCAECHKLIHTTVPGCTYAELHCSEKQ